LKNSKFTFQFETAIDITNIETLEDIFQDIPEINISPSLDEYLIYDELKNVINPNSEYFLTHFDYLFKKVLELP
jgi:hypothetical protein